MLLHRLASLFEGNISHGFLARQSVLEDGCDASFRKRTCPPATPGAQVPSLNDSQSVLEGGYYRFVQKADLSACHAGRTSALCKRWGVKRRASGDCYD
jgi:hypothetical protein